ncbi:reverse transcriptase [Penicillium expansum]|uniref:Reverse transcriptase n=1 Tax=Penicillium expansum TaxID=27334 RepID=A0A0A2IW35_PENEN|nr:reverse transcriptase [Penicillium expansum]KGO46653.1 reverse transcriptase [Penicillium expansum]KGO53510.1 reverse transcriptase [Penicillium expansum]KGO66212.1 reverse transcriptase [Penicillium expansum]
MRLNVLSRQLNMAMANGALPQTLKSITATKISELSKQRVLFDRRKTEILAVANAAPDRRTHAQALLDGISRLKGYKEDSLDKDDLDLDADSSDKESDDILTSRGVGRLQPEDHKNIRRFLLQSRHDPSISQAALQGRIDQLEKELRYLEIKHEHSAFYSNLVTEWLSELDGSINSTASETKSTDSNPDFETVGRAEMHEQRATWESLVFTAATHVDEDAIRTYLNDLFTHSKLSQQALKDLRTSIESFGKDLASKGEWLDVDELKWVSGALLKSDILSDEKTAILKEFMRNNEVAQEVADVLNMRIASLESWTWTGDAEGIPVEMRRQLNGKYRVFMDEDLLDALLLQYIGTMWAVKLRKVFETFLGSNAWKTLREDIPENHKEMRKHFLGRGANNDSGRINELRRETYADEYFMSQLPTSTAEGAREYDDAESGEKTVLDTKHSLLHLLITESIIHKHQRGDFTAVRSDFEWFGPSMPHATMLTVLKFFGVSDLWIKFFVVFLEAPLKFSQDGTDASVQIRKRGLPMSHTLGDCFGESVLFCMDYAVNQATEGAFLYRLHDDFWFWGAENTCVKAWQAMEQFTKVMGLKLNQKKTGTVQMGLNKAPKQSALPTGDIRWGFLVLDAEQERFIIDQAKVDEHIEELSRQLSSCKSVFAWVQAWNSYFGRFFTNNFANPAICFGRDHIDMAISTLSRIERTLFNKALDDKNPSDQISGVTDHLRTVIADRFDIHDLPDGFFYYPIELGGLGLLNPFIRLLAMRENIKQTPRKLLHKASLRDEKEYETAKERFAKNGADIGSQFGSKLSGKPKPFMSLEEYTRYPETFSSSLVDVYTTLTEVPSEISVARTSSFESEQNSLDKKSSAGSISPYWGQMTPYWRWVAELYHEDMVRTYGSLAAVNRESMPLGVVKTLREGKFRWQG